MVAHYHTNSEALTSTFSDVSDTKKFSMIKADLSSESDVRRLFDSFDESPIQILVINHATFSFSGESIAEMSLERWNKTIATNLTSPFLLVREFLHRLKSLSTSDLYREKVNVILVGSTAGKYGEAGHADYAASKSGTENLQN